MTLRAAILARRSTSHQETSIERQVADARAFADARGWSLADAHVYFVEEVSGSIAARPDLDAVLAAARSVPRPFDVLIIQNEDRLSRVMWRQLALLVDLHEAGLRVFRYCDGQEVMSDTSEQKLLMAIQAYLSEAERDKIVSRTREASHYRGRNGWVTGGKLFGYDNVRVGEGRGSHVERRINEAEAAVIRRIFRRQAEGAGIRTIAGELNRDKIPSPRAGKRGIGTWAGSAIRAMLLNEHYKGVLVFGKKRNSVRGGKKVVLSVPEAEWIRVDAPDLRLIDDETWESVQRRFKGRPSFGGTGGTPRGILIGNLVCGGCGGRVYALGGTGGMGEHRYACGRRHQGGAITCGNAHKTQVSSLDAETARAIFERLLSPEVVDAVVERAVLLHQERKGGRSSELAEVQARIDAARRKRDNFIAAIGSLADASSVGSITAALQKAEEELRFAEGRLSALANARPRDDGADRLRATYRQRLETMPALLTSDVVRGRAVLRDLLAEPLRANPVRDGGEVRWLIRGNLRPVGLFQNDGDPNGIRTRVAGMDTHGGSEGTCWPIMHSDSW